MRDRRYETVGSGIGAICYYPLMRVGRKRKDLERARYRRRGRNKP